VTNFRFVCQCLNDTLEGVRDGLSHFSGPSRVASIFMLHSRAPVCIFDPQNLLRGHEPKFKELYLEQNDWLLNFALPSYKSRFGHLKPEKNLQLAGLVSYGGRSNPVFYQMWFTEHHPDMCSTAPTERWLEHAAWRFSHDIANEPDLYTGISGNFLREYSTYAVRDQIVDHMNLALGWDTHLRIFPILDAVLGISKTREEGAWPRGRLIVVEQRSLAELEFVVRFPEADTPVLENFKHVRKLLMAVEDGALVLVSDGQRIFGIASGSLPSFCIIADFRGQYGFLHVNDQPLCSFSDGNFHSTTHRAKLVQVEETLLESNLDAESGHSLFQTIARLVHHAQESHFGCTLVIDLNPSPVVIAGQRFHTALDLRNPEHFRLARSFLRVDGALHIGRDLRLHGFACLLDGRTIAGEDRSRGARFNSALRFTSEHSNLIVVVVSADRPVAVIEEGVEVSAQCQWHPVSACQFAPQTLSDWILESDSDAENDGP
jgi:Probable sensor domain DACND/Probable sensor domain DACNH/DisA bacterial checkpoint controller nucleotide-binding